jgi:uncharacterized membrane protein
MNQRTCTRVPALVLAAIAIAASILVPTLIDAADAPTNTTVTTAEAATYAKVKPLLERNCSICHSQKPLMPAYGKAPDGVTFDSVANLAQFAARVLVVATQTDQMPPGNLTRMTDAERKMLGAAIEAQWPTSNAGEE